MEIQGRSEFTTHQATLLTKAMFIAGGFFILIGLGSMGLSYAFNNVIISGNFGIWMTVMMLSLLAGMILSMVWTGALLKGDSPGLIALAFGLYSAIMIVVFGYLFALLRHYTPAAYGWIAFATVDGVFLIAACIGKIMGHFGAFTVNKMIGAVSAAMGTLMFIFLILAIVGMCVKSAPTILASEAIFNFVMVGMCIVSFFYIVLDIWQIAKTSEFSQFTYNEVSSAYTWYCGYKLLTDLLNLLLLVIMLIIRTARRVNYK